tara:strand:+ start:4162 stop:4998 length:837 start_codon:yes stop_codon:yes gene_type:complete
LGSILLCQPILDDWKIINVNNTNNQKIFTPSKIAIGVFSDIYLMDSEQSLLTRLLPNGTYFRTVGGWGENGELFNSGSDITASYGLDVFLIDSDSHRLLRFDRKLNYITEMDLFSLDHPIEFPISIEKYPSGEILISSESDAEVKLLAFNGEVISTIGDEKYGSDRFTYVTAIAINDENNIGIIDNNERFLVFNKSGRIIWQREIKGGGDFLGTIDSDWIISRKNGDFLIIERFSQKLIDQKIPFSKNISDIAIKDNRIYVIEEDVGTIWSTLIFLDE